MIYGSKLNMSGATIKYKLGKMKGYGFATHKRQLSLKN